jgi:hypothetical protein
LFGNVFLLAKKKAAKKIPRKQLKKGREVSLKNDRLKCGARGNNRKVCTALQTA